jgi:hypothetical protein
VAELSRAIDPYLMLSGLWDAWGEVLDRVAQAARRIGDRALTAWVLHQSGTRAAGLHQIEEAIGLLRQALSIRRAIGDSIGARITQHNLDVLTLPPGGGGNRSAPVKPAPSRTRGAIKTFAVLVVLTVLTFGGYTLTQSTPDKPPVDPPVSADTVTLTTSLVTVEKLSTPTPVIGEKITQNPTATPTVSASSKPQEAIVCHPTGEYVADVTIPDGTLLESGKSFRKTWRVKNNGDCAWSEEVRLVFESGSHMNGPAAVAIGAPAVGETTDVSVDLMAPTAAGSYTGRWKLVTSDGTILTRLTVVIKIAPPQQELAAPQLIGPIGDAPIDCASSQAVTLAWADPNNLSGVVYEWELSGQLNRTTSASVVLSLACDTKYGWRVRVVDSAGNSSPWSNYGNFVIVANQSDSSKVIPPPPPDKAGPDITVEQAIPDPTCYGAGCLDPTLLVTAYVADPAGVSEVYIRFYYIESYTKVESARHSVKATESTPGKYQAIIDHNSFHAYDTLKGQAGAIYWRVEAIDMLGNPNTNGDHVTTIKYWPD